MLENSKAYFDVLEDIKTRVKLAQRNAVMSVNSELITLYWSIGKTINDKSVWGWIHRNIPTTFFPKAR